MIQVSELLLYLECDLNSKDSRGLTPALACALNDEVATCLAMIMHKCCLKATTVESTRESFGEHFKLAQSTCYFHSLTGFYFAILGSTRLSELFFWALNNNVKDDDCNDSTEIQENWRSFHTFTVAEKPRALTNETPLQMLSDCTTNFIDELILLII
jgi:hypothetical protein